MPPVQKNRPDAGQRSGNRGRSRSGPSGPGGSARPSDNRPRNFTYGNTSGAQLSQAPDAHNPNEQQYEREFDFERRERDHIAKASQHETKDSGGGSPRASVGDNRPLAEREAAPSWDTNLSDSQDQQGGGGNRGRGRSRRGGVSSRAKKWLIGSLVTLILGMATAIPAALSGAFIHMKELASDWANKNNHSYFSKRTAKYMQKRLFQADKNCAEGVKCRFKGGVTDPEIDKMKEAGLNPEVGQDGDRKYIKSFNTTDVSGNPLKVTADNFDEHYGGDEKFRSHMDKIAKPKSMLLRGKTTLKLVFDKFGIKRNRTIDGENDRERNKNLRADIYGEGNDTEKANSAPDGGDEDKDGTGKTVQGVDDAINEAAQQERERLESSGYDRPPSIIPDSSNLDLSPDKAVEVANGVLKDNPIKEAGMGIFAGISKACSGYQFIRAAIFGAKVYKVIGLIKYAVIFMTIADKLKAGDSAAGEIGYLAGLLFKPSNSKESYGKTFFQSEGFNLIFQGKIADHRGLARFTTGASFLKYLQGAKKVFESVGANKATCKQVNSWYGQTFLFVAGLSLTIFSAGTLEVAGAVAGAALGMVVSALVAYITPLLIQYAAGTVAPDPTDKEGGYGMGNAIAAGMGAFGDFAGGANGERVLTTADATAVEMESNKEMAFETKVENYGKSPFSFDSSTSIPSQLALAFAPVMASPLSQGTLQSVASVITSPLSLFGSSFSNIVTGGVNAQNDISKGGEYCSDEDYRAVQLAVDAFCSKIRGEKGSTIDDRKYAPDLVDDWMVDNGHVDDKTGTPKSDDYKKYIASCVGDEENTPPPISPDGGGSDVGEDVDTRWCFSTEEKFNYFRFFITTNASESAYKDSIDGTLGEDTGSEGDTALGGTGQNGKLPDSALCELGSQWSGQRLRCDAQEAFVKLAAAFQKDMGKPIQLTDSYRTYDQQVKCREEKGDLCATPGTSNHGCGQAIDFAGGIQKGPGDPAYNWMQANAGTYGWIHPDWAKPGSSKPEAWHWEYGTNGEKNSGTCQT
jgi:hypothetical protein